MKSLRNAFTLAEVLVTLGIIGVVAAMTLPTVIANVRYHELKTQLKKTYSELNQIAQKFYYDEGMSVPDYTYMGSGSSSNAIFRDFLPKQITGFAKKNDWTHADVDDEHSSLTTMPYELYNLRGQKMTNICDISGMYTDAAGRLYSWNDSPNKGDNGPIICVDINGVKRPNTYGKDFFLFVFTVDGFVIPMGQEHKNNRRLAGNLSGNGVNIGPQYCSKTTGSFNTTCAYYALREVSPEDEGNSYWKDFLGIK